MLMQAQPVFDCCEAVQEQVAARQQRRARVLYMSPRGRIFDQRMASSRIDANAYYNIIYRNRRHFIQPERLGMQRFYSMYAPLFDGDGRLLPTHGVYPETIRNLAAERGVRLVDLEKATMDLVQKAGEEGSRGIYCHVNPGDKNYPEGLADNSHLQEAGAARIAGLFLTRLEHPEISDADFERLDAGDVADLISREDSVLC